MRRDLTLLTVVALVAMALLAAYFLFSGSANAEITSISTDSGLYHSNEIMNVTVIVTAPSAIDGVILSLEGIEDTSGDRHLNAEIPANLSPGITHLSYQHQLPPCSHCAGLDPGTYRFNVTLVKDGQVLDAKSHQIQLEQ